MTKEEMEIIAGKIREGKASKEEIDMFLDTASGLLDEIMHEAE
jgi:hypothetical protein